MTTRKFKNLPSQSTHTVSVICVLRPPVLDDEMQEAEKVMSSLTKVVSLSLLFLI